MHEAAAGQTRRREAALARPKCIYCRGRAGGDGAIESGAVEGGAVEGDAVEGGAVEGGAGERDGAGERAVPVTTKLSSEMSVQTCRSAERRRGGE